MSAVKVVEIMINSTKSCEDAAQHNNDRQRFDTHHAA